MPAPSPWPALPASSPRTNSTCWSRWQSGPAGIRIDSVSYPDNVRTIAPQIDFPFGETPLQLDSRAPKLPVAEYRRGENRFRMLELSDPEAARRLMDGRLGAVPGA